jgi:hypothetical protein
MCLILADIGCARSHSRDRAVAVSLSSIIEPALNDFVLQVELVNRRSYLLATACFAHCQNFSAAGLSRPFSAAMPTEIGFGSGMMCKSFTRFPKL